jgi:Uma2 family endonuclease
VLGPLFSNLLGRGPCRVFTAELRVRVSATGLSTYPDVVVVCGDLERDPEDANAVVNPTAIVEVLSPGTEAYDRGKKLEHYRQIASLRHVLLVSQGERRVDRVTREVDGSWSNASYVGEGDLALDALSVRLPIDAIYGPVASVVGGEASAPARTL